MKKSKLVKTVGCCPACESAEILAFDGDFFCLDCDWNSLKMSVERGDLTELINAWDEMQEDETHSGGLQDDQTSGSAA